MGDAVFDPHVLPVPAIDVKESSLEGGDHRVAQLGAIVQELLLAPSRATRWLFDLPFVQFGLGPWRHGVGCPRRPEPAPGSGPWALLPSGTSGQGPPGYGHLPGRGPEDRAGRIRVPHGG